MLQVTTGIKGARSMLCGSRYSANEALRGLDVILTEFLEAMTHGSPEVIQRTAAQCLRYCVRHLEADPPIFTHCIKVADLALCFARGETLTADDAIRFPGH